MGSLPMQSEQSNSRELLQTLFTINRLSHVLILNVARKISPLQKRFSTLRTNMKFDAFMD